MFAFLLIRWWRTEESHNSIYSIWFQGYSNKKYCKFMKFTANFDSTMHSVIWFSLVVGMILEIKIQNRSVMCSSLSQNVNDESWWNWMLSRIESVGTVNISTLQLIEQSKWESKVKKRPWYSQINYSSSMCNKIQ